MLDSQRNRNTTHDISDWARSPTEVSDMNDPLAIYLHDHLAGSTVAVDLLQAMRRKHADEALGQFAATMLLEIQADRTILKNLADRIGAGSSQLKELSAWLSEKVSRFKLDRGPQGLGTFEALEFLALGVLGKLSLWRALAVSTDGRLQGTDFDHLAARAQSQYAQIEDRRLDAAKIALVQR
jgi:hypothetical protein